jgi:hypothetical protein
MAKKGKKKKKRQAKQTVPPGVAVENVIADYKSICVGLNIGAVDIEGSFVATEDALLPTSLDVQPLWTEDNNPIRLGVGGCRALISAITKRELVPFIRPVVSSKEVAVSSAKIASAHLVTDGFWFCSPGEASKVASAFCERGQGPFYPAQMRTWAGGLLPQSTLIAHSLSGKPPADDDYQSLENCPELSRLNELGNFFTSTGALFGAPYSLLTVLKLNDCAIGTNGAIYVSHLLRPGSGVALGTLELRNNGIDLDGYVQLGDVLISNRSLHTLVLDSNRALNDWACNILCRALALKHGLTHLSMQDCTIGLAGCIGLAKMLTRTPSRIGVLSLLGNNLTPAGLIALCAGLKVHPSLTSLNLKGTGIGKHTLPHHSS